MAAETDDTRRPAEETMRELCLDVIVRERFGGTPVCLSCGSEELAESGTTPSTEAQVYNCLACGHTFNSLSNTVFNRRRLSLIEVCYTLHQKDEQSARQISRALNIGYEGVRRTIANLPDDPPVDPATIQTAFSETELRAAAPNASTDGEGTEWNGLLKIRVLEPAHKRLSEWEAEHGDCTHTEAIDELLDRLEQSSIAVGPADAPDIGTQDPDKRVTISIRRRTKRRLKIWKELHGYTFHDAVVVLLNVVG